MSKKVAFHTLGCRLNLSETGSIADGFVKRGYQVVAFGDEADVTFLNTCTVTDGADSTCRNLIRKADKYSPEGKVVVAGCYAQMEAEKIKAMQGVDLILGTDEKYKVFDYLEEDEQTLVKIEQTNEFWGASTTEADSRTRAFLKIQDGCNYICSFCVIPFARGRSRTISIADAVAQTKKLISEGFKEIVLTGVNIGEYERTSGEKLSDLVQSIVEIPELERLRLSSVEPNTITKDLLEVLLNSKKYQPHFHIPLQSGSDEILKRMRRKYNKQFYREVIELVQSYFPDASFGADVILGYPGESDEQFMETYQFIQELPLTHLHVFPYSKRKKTTAAKSDNHIQSDVKKKRVKEIIALGEEKLSQKRESFIGKEVEVLIEKVFSTHAEGYCGQYLRVKLPADNIASNDIVRCKLLRVEGQKLIGSLI